jgi:hypothetical protein
MAREGVTSVERLPYQYPIAMQEIIALAFTDESPGHHPRPGPQGFPPEEDLFYSILHPEDRAYLPESAWMMVLSV